MIPANDIGRTTMTALWCQSPSNGSHSGIWFTMEVPHKPHNYVHKYLLKFISKLIIIISGTTVEYVPTSW